MAIPSGYDLFEKGWPPEILPDDITAHPLYGKFLEASKTNGFDTDSGGFQEDQKGFFLFFLLGTMEAGPLRSIGPVPGQLA